MHSALAAYDYLMAGGENGQDNLLHTVIALDSVMEQSATEILNDVVQNLYLSILKGTSSEPVEKEAPTQKCAECESEAEERDEDSAPESSSTSSSTEESSSKSSVKIKKFDAYDVASLVRHFFPSDAQDDAAAAGVLATPDASGARGHRPNINVHNIEGQRKIHVSPELAAQNKKLLKDAKVFEVAHVQTFILMQKKIAAANGVSVKGGGGKGNAKVAASAGSANREIMFQINRKRVQALEDARDELHRLVVDKWMAARKEVKSLQQQSQSQQSQSQGAAGLSHSGVSGDLPHRPMSPTSQEKLAEAIEEIVKRKGNKGLRNLGEDAMLAALRSIEEQDRWINEHHSKLSGSYSKRAYGK